MVCRPGYVGDPTVTESRCLLHGGTDERVQPTNVSVDGFRAVRHATCADRGRRDMKDRDIEIVARHDAAVGGDGRTARCVVCERGMARRRGALTCGQTCRAALSRARRRVADAG